MPEMLWPRLFIVVFSIILFQISTKTFHSKCPATTLESLDSEENQFIEKNNDALHASLEGLVQESANPLLKVLFASGSSVARGKLNFISVGSKFKTQLGELMDKLEKNV